MYQLTLSNEARKESLQLRKSEPQAYKKLGKLLVELAEHPYTGTGHPEQLKGYQTPTWSRRISHKHRLVYEVYEESISVYIVAVVGHYNDK